MDGICYVCNKQTSDGYKNFTKIESQHTQTPISDFIKLFLDDFELSRNIDDGSNCICIECLQQIDDYDWMRQQVDMQETKLRDLLLETEMKLNKKIHPKGIGDATEDCHREMVFADGLNIHEQQQQPTPTPTSSQPSSSKPQQQASTSSSMVNNASILNPTIQSNREDTFKSIPKVISGNKQMTIRQKGKLHKVRIIKANPEDQSKTTAITTNAKTNAVSSANSIETSPTHLHTKALSQPSSSPQQPSTSSSMLNNAPKMIPTHPSNDKCTPISKRNTTVAKKQITIRENDISYQYKIIVENSENQTKTSDTVLQPVLTSEATKSPPPPPPPPAAAVNTNAITSSVNSNERTHSNTIESSSATPLDFPKPLFPYAFLIAMALKNSSTGTLQISEICKFLREHFPYFRTALNDWKRNIQNTLSYNNNFMRIKRIAPIGNVFHEIRVWTMVPSKILEMDEKILGFLRDHAINIRSSMLEPETMPALLRGDMKPNNEISKSTVPKQQNYPKPDCSCACLIAMALKNSQTGSLQMWQINRFVCDHFPYFRTAPKHWKNGFGLTLNRSNSFAKVGFPDRHGSRSLWTMKKSTIIDMELEKLHDSIAIRKAMDVPENLPALLRGEMKYGSMNGNNIKLDDTVLSEPENEPADSDDDALDLFDEIDIDDASPFQFELKTEDDQNEFDDNDLQPMKKRARLDINN